MVYLKNTIIFIGEAGIESIFFPSPSSTKVLLHTGKGRDSILSGIDFAHIQETAGLCLTPGGCSCSPMY